MSDNPAEMPAQAGGFEVANRGPADDGRPACHYVTLRRAG